MKLKIKSEYIFEITLIFLLFHQAIFPSQMTFEALLGTILAGLLLVFFNKKIYLNPFLISYLVFLVFTFITALLGFGMGDVFYQVRLLLGGWLSSICIYNYLMKFKNIERFMIIYIFVTLISMCIIWLLLGDRAIVSRMGHNGSGSIISYYIGEVPIYKSSNGTANICAIAILFLLYFIQQYGKKLYIPILFLLVTVLLCGSRKVFLILIIYFVYYYFFVEKGITARKLIILCIMPIVIYLLLYGIPVVYQSFTVRIESMILNLLNVTNSLDGNSYIERMRLKNEALNWIRQKPILGYGFNSFQQSVGNGAENNILQLMVSFGLIGTILYYSFLPFLIKDILRNRKKQNIIIFFSVLVISILIQDVGSVSYSWQRVTMWFSVFYAVVNIYSDQ